MSEQHEVPRDQALLAMQAWIGKRVRGTLVLNGEPVGVDGRLDAIGPIEDKIMVAIGQLDGEDGEIHFVPDTEDSTIHLELAQ